MSLYTTRFLAPPGETQEILDQAAKSRKPIHQDQALTLVIELYSRFFLFLVVEYEVEKITQQRKPPERQRFFFHEILVSCGREIAFVAYYYS